MHKTVSKDRCNRWNL